MDSGGFKKKRQNVILLSSVLILLDYSGAKLDKLNVFGININLSHKEVSLILWGLFFYFLYRFIIDWKDNEKESFVKDY